MKKAMKKAPPPAKSGKQTRHYFTKLDTALIKEEVSPPRSGGREPNTLLRAKDKSADGRSIAPQIASGKTKSAVMTKLIEYCHSSWAASMSYNFIAWAVAELKSALMRKLMQLLREKLNNTSHRQYGSRSSVLPGALRLLPKVP